MSTNSMPRRVLVPGTIAVTTMIVLYGLIPSVRTFSALGLALCTIGLAIVVITFQWALRSEHEPVMPGRVEGLQDLPDLWSPSSAEEARSEPHITAPVLPSVAVNQSRTTLTLDAASSDVSLVDVPTQEPQLQEVHRSEQPTTTSDSFEVLEARVAVDGGQVSPKRTQEAPSGAGVDDETVAQSRGFHLNWAIPKKSQHPRAEAPLAWRGKGETISVGSYSLIDPLVYVCDGQQSLCEASCIDRRQPIGKPVVEPAGSLGYYPEYSRLSADQKANYLQWLASGRSSPLSDIGYAFLYFYGFERRLLIEGLDLSPIVKEVVRLLETYDVSGSFDGYLSRFLSYSLARTGIGTLKEKWFQAVFERTRAQRDEQHLAVGLAWLFANERPLPAAWARRIARLDPRAPRSVVLDRLPDQFNALFAKRYVDRYGEGLRLKAAKRDREVIYRPASPSLLGHQDSSNGLKPVKISHVMGIQSQFAALVQIWTSCIEELKPLSRVFAKGPSVSNHAAFDLLPDELKATTEHPDKPRWEQLATALAQEDGTVIVEIRALAEIQGYAEKTKLTIKQSESLAQTAHSVGFVIEPDARITSRAYAWNDQIVLFRPENSPSLPTTNHFAAAALLLELGMFIAASDGQIEEIEVNHIASFLESKFLLEPPDARRLEALKRVFLIQKPSIAGIGKRLEKVIEASQVESFGQFLFGVAAANGVVEKSEITALRSAFRSLGIDPSILDRQLAEYRRLATEPVEVIEQPATEQTGEEIPTQEPVHSRRVYTLDRALIETLMRETDQVRSILGEAMGDDHTPDIDDRELENAPEPEVRCVRFEGLDERYSAVLTLICRKDSWIRLEFDNLLRQHSLMMSATLDIVNEWAYERFNDPLLEFDGDLITVHRSLILELL